MGVYVPLVSVEVSHDFFATGQCQSLVFVPTPVSAIGLDETGLLARTTSHGLQVFYDTALTERLLLSLTQPEVPVHLAYKVFSRDPCFANYTEPSLFQDDAIVYLATRPAPGTGRLHAAESVSSGDFARLDDPRVADLLSPRDRLVRPLWLLDVDMACVLPPRQDTAPPRRQARGRAGRLSVASAPASPVVPQVYTVRFKARQTFWKYYLCGEFAREGLAITDLDQQLAFTATGQERLANQRLAMTFRSTTPIPLQERPAYRLQLREGGAGNGKVLMRRLPVASAQQLSRDSVGGEQAVIAEVFIHG